MNEYTTQPLLFSPVSGKKVEADFDGGEITSDAGVLFLAETERQVGIIDAFSRCISDNRHQSYVDHSLPELLSQRIYQIGSGYEDANDSNTLRIDPAFKAAVGRLPVSGKDLASQPTICRLENKVRRTELLRMGYALADKFIDSYDSPPSLIVLDFDDTEDKVHGTQQGSLFNGYYDSHCYLPLHIYEGLSGKLIASILKPGKRSSGKQVVAILKRLIKRIRSHWPKTLILFRGDSHFCTPEVLQYCQKHDLLYCLGLTGNAVLKRQTEPLIQEAKNLFAQTGQQMVKLYDAFTYRAKSWDSPQKVVVKVEVSHKGCNLRFVVSNLTDPEPEVIYGQIYTGRGQMENYIKEHKLHIKSDRTSCHDFAANQFRLFLHSAAYVLLHSFRENVLKGTEFAKAQFNTIQLHLLKVGAKVRELKTKIKLHLPSSFPHKTVLIKACAILSTLATTAANTS